MIKWKDVLALALAFFLAGVGINLTQMGIDYAVMTYQDYKMAEFQKELIQNYEKDHPQSKPETKDFRGDGHGGVIPKDSGHDTDQL